MDHGGHAVIAKGLLQLPLVLTFHRIQKKLQALKVSGVLFAKKEVISNFDLMPCDRVIRVD